MRGNAKDQTASVQAPVRAAPRPELKMSGGCSSYGAASLVDINRQARIYTGRILTASQSLIFVCSGCLSSASSHISKVAGGRLVVSSISARLPRYPHWGPNAAE